MLVQPFNKLMDARDIARAANDIVKTCIRESTPDELRTLLTRASRIYGTNEPKNSEDTPVNQFKRLVAELALKRGVQMSDYDPSDRDMIYAKVHAYLLDHIIEKNMHQGILRQLKDFEVRLTPETKELEEKLGIDV